MNSSLKSKNKNSLFSRIFYNNRYCWLAFGCSCAIMLVVYICYSLIPFGDITILRMDLYHQYGPLYAELYDRITNLESFLYSWNTGLGSSFLGNFYNYLCSPLSLIILIFGHENMPEAIAAIILLQAAFSSASFCFYLKKSFGEHSFATAGFGVLYSFCGFFIAYYWNVMWLDAMVLFPLMILGIERIINMRKPALYIFSLAMLLLTNYYMGFMACIFAVLYFLVYYFGKYEIAATYRDVPFTVSDDGEQKVKIVDKIKYSTFLNGGVIFAVSSIVSAALVAFALVPVYFILQNCSATSGTMPESVTSYFSIFDFLANHLASVTPTIRSSGTDVLPNVYCGMATVLLVPLYLFSKSIPLREKIANVALLGVLYLSFNLNILNYIWHAFHFPNDLPYRFSFMYSFILLVLAYKAFRRLGEFTGKEILGVGTAVLFGIILIQKITSKNVSDNTIIISIIFVVLYTVIFYLFSTKKYQSSAMAVLMLCCICAEAISADTDNYSMDRTKTEYAGDYQDFKKIKSELDDMEDGSFYRMELTSLRARMDASWYNYNGVSTFSSMAYEKLSNLQQQLGMFGNYINSYTYHPQTPVYNAMMSLKYIVNNNAESIPPLNNELYSYVSTQGKFNAYLNNYSLPIAYCVSNDITSWNFESSNPFEVQNDYFMRATGIENVFTQIEPTNDYYYNIDPIFSGLDTGYMTFYKTSTGSEGSISFTLIPEKDQNVYLFVESPGIDNITVSIGYEQYSQNVDREYIYDLGMCQSGIPILVEMTVKQDTDNATLNFFAYGLDMEAFTAGYDKLKTGGMNVKDFEDTEITGSITAAEDCTVYTSIPYDDGWSVTVDGKKLSQEDIVAIGDAILGFKISAGEHDIELHYTPRGLWIGLIISLVTALLLIAAIILSKRRVKKLSTSPISKNISETADNNSVSRGNDPSETVNDNPEQIIPEPYPDSDE